MYKWEQNFAITSFAHHSFDDLYCFVHSQLVVCNASRHFKMQSVHHIFILCIVHGWWCECVYFTLRDDVLPSIFHLRFPLHNHYSQYLFYYIFTNELAIQNIGGRHVVTKNEKTADIPVQFIPSAFTDLSRETIQSLWFEFT